MTLYVGCLTMPDAPGPRGWSRLAGMRLVASVRPVTNMEEAAAVLGEAAGITLAEARMRLAPEPPALLASVAPGQADVLLGALRRAGLAVLAVEPSAPTEAPRTQARGVVFGDTGVTFQPRTGEPLELPWSEVSTVLRGASSTRVETETRHESKKASLAMAIASQGLKMSRTVERTERSQQEDTEQVLLVFGRDGRRAVLREREVDFSCLGAGKQLTRMANMAALAKVLKERAPHAFHDERLLRLGRRPLPLFAAGESHEQVGKTAHKRVDTASGLELLGEVLFRAVEARLLP